MSGNATLGTAIAEVSLDYSKLEAGIAASKTLIGGLGTSLLGIGAIGVGLAVTTTKMAGDFQAGLTSLVTGAGESQRNLAMVGTGIEDVAVKTGSATKDLIAAEFLIDSSGQKGKQSLDTLTAAAEGAKVGSASLADVANGVTTEMTDYAKSGLTAAQATNELIASVKQGKTHVGDLSNALANILPTSSAAGVGLTDVMGAMATMTHEGIPAAQAATYLRQTILGLVAPSAGTVKALEAVGLKSSDVAAEMKKSLPDALQMITDAVGKKFPAGSAEYVNAIKNISGGSKTMQGMLDLTGDHLKTFQDDVSNISGTVKSAGDSIAGWSLTQDDFNTKVDQAREVVETLGIKIGTALLPFATTLFDLITPLVSGFDDWITKSGVLNQITGDLSGTVNDISGFISTLTGNANSCGTTFGQANPILYDFQTVIGNVKDILPDVGAFLNDVGTDVNQNLLPPLESLGTNVANAVTNFSNWADKSGAAKTALQDLSGLISATTQVLGPLIQGVSDVVGWLGGGGAGTDTLVFALSAVATAFVGLKIADTVASLSNMWSSWAEGAGVIANVGDAIKGKLGGAIGDFLSSQAPSLKATFDDMKVKATDAATAETTVGTEAEVAGTKVTIATGTMKGEYEQLGLFADEAGTSVEAIGTDAGLAAGEVTVSTATMDTDMAGVEGSAAAAGTATAGVGAAAKAGVPLVSGLGAAAAGAVGAVAALGLAEFGLAKWIKDNGWLPDAPKTGPEWITHSTAAIKAMNTDVSTSFKAMCVDVQGSVATMDGSVVQSMNEMNVKSYTDVKSFTGDAMTMFQHMDDYGTQQMQSLDENTIGYWNDVAGYIASHPINAAINIDMGQGSTYSKVSSGIQKNFYAEGTDSALPGWAVVGEKGPELKKLNGGETILPHGVMPYSSGGGVPYTSSNSGGSGQSGGNSHAALLAAAREMGKEIASALASHQTLLSVDGNVLGQAVVQRMRVRAGLRN